MSNLKQFNEASTNDIDDIAKVLKELALASDVPMGDLIDAIGDLKIAAQNPYNRDSFRVFYNILDKIADNYTDFINQY